MMGKANGCVLLMYVIIDTIGHAQGIGNQAINPYIPCPTTFYINPECAVNLGREN